MSPSSETSTGATFQRPSRVLKSALILAVRLYQAAISPLLGQNCRFEPTCSEYVRQALAKYGVLRGSWLGLRRLLRCHPFSEGGSDPVP